MDDAMIVAIFRYGFLLLLGLFVFFTVRTVAVRMRVPAAAREPKPARAQQASGPGKDAPKRPNVAIVRTGGKKVATVKLREGMRMGRADDCELRPPDDYLSQHHARFIRRDGAWFVEDLGSTNGTKVNGRPLSGPIEVRAGDKIQAGTTELELRR